jgi:hypothetical protein
MVAADLIKLLNETHGANISTKTKIPELLAKALEFHVSVEEVEELLAKRYANQYTLMFATEYAATAPGDSDISTRSSSDTDTDTDTDTDSENFYSIKHKTVPIEEPVPPKDRSINDDKVTLVAVLSELGSQLGCKRGSLPCMSWSNTMLMVWIIKTYRTTDIEPFLVELPDSKYSCMIKRAILLSIHVSSLVDEFDAKGYEPTEEDPAADDESRDDRQTFVEALQTLGDRLGGNKMFKRGSMPAKSWNETQLIIWFLEVYRCPGLGINVESWIQQLSEKYAKKVEKCHAISLKVTKVVNSYHKSTIKKLASTTSL